MKYLGTVTQSKMFWWTIFVLYLGIAALIMGIGMNWSFNAFRDDTSIAWQALINASLSIVIIGTVWPLIVTLILSVILKILINELIRT